MSDRDTCGLRFVLEPDGACSGPYVFSGSDCLRSEDVFQTYKDCRDASSGETGNYNPLDDSTTPFIEEYSLLVPHAARLHPTTNCVTLAKAVKGVRDYNDGGAIRAWCGDHREAFVAACAAGPRLVTSFSVLEDTEPSRLCRAFLDTAPR